MPNFTATVQMSHRDVVGMIGGFARQDIVEDPANEGRVLRWINRASGLPSLPMIRQPGDAVTYAGGRMGDFWQRTVADQPELVVVGGQRKVRFSRTDQFFMTAAIKDTGADRGAAIGFQFTQGDDAADTQVIYDDQTQMKITRRAAGVSRFKMGTPTAVGVADLQSGRWLATANATEIRAKRDNGLTVIAQAGDATFQLADGLAYLGRSAGGDYLDGDLDALYIWARELSPIEMDFVWHSLDEDGASFATEDRAQMAIARWTDGTGTVGTNQINRIRNEFPLNPYYKLATIEAGGPWRVVITAAEDGVVKSDALLNDGPFDLTWTEAPGLYPAVYQDAGWSSVFDVAFTQPGHYTARVSREMGGAVFLHFDVKVNP